MVKRKKPRLSTAQDPRVVPLLALQDEADKRHDLVHRSVYAVLKKATHPDVKPQSRDYDALAQLAAELKLTGMQRRFAEALALDPDSSQTKAAIAAGASPKFAHERGSKWARLAKVRRYYEALTVASREERAQATSRAVAGHIDVLKLLTVQMRAKLGDFLTLLPTGGCQINIDAVMAAPAGVIKHCRRGKADKFKLVLADSQAAAKALLKYYTYGVRRRPARSATPRRATRARL